jgi:hypothetical protein
VHQDNDAIVVDITDLVGLQRKLIEVLVPDPHDFHPTLAPDGIMMCREHRPPRPSPRHVRGDESLTNAKVKRGTRICAAPAELKRSSHDLHVLLRHG